MKKTIDSLIFSKKRYCLECSQEYTIKENYQTTCLTCKDKLKKRFDDIQEEHLNKICKNCNKTFRKKIIKSAQIVCESCNKERAHMEKVKYQEKNNIQSMKENRRSRRNGLPLEELIRREEYKRLFDEKYANNYIRGHTK